MGSLTYSGVARSDLEKIASDIIDNNGALVAGQVIARIRKSLAILGEFPNLGRARPRLGIGIRSWPMRPYLAF